MAEVTQTHELTGPRPDLSPLSRFRCSGCGYGASCRVAPERCPMCGGSEWDFEQWRPFKEFLSASIAR